MLEKVADRARHAAEAKARALGAELAAKAAGELPPGISALAEPDGIRLTGRGLARRMALEPMLRTLIGRLR